MNFYMPVKVYSEENCIKNHAAELASLGQKALIVTGRSSARKCGAFYDVAAALDQYGVSYVEFAEVEENPSVETVFAAKRTKREKPDGANGQVLAAGDKRLEHRFEFRNKRNEQHGDDQNAHDAKHRRIDHGAGNFRTQFRLIFQKLGGSLERRFEKRAFRTRLNNA